jgi:hypothetical protein
MLDNSVCGLYVFTLCKESSFTLYFLIVFFTKWKSPCYKSLEHVLCSDEKLNVWDERQLIKYNSFLSYAVFNLPISYP